MSGPRAGPDLRQLFIPTKTYCEQAFVMSGSNAEPDLRQIFNPTKTYCEQALVMSGPRAVPDLHCWQKQLRSMILFALPAWRGRG